MTANIQSWMLPQGVVESLLKETKKIDFLENQATETFTSWGYKRVRPPIMEYLDSLVEGLNVDDLILQTIQFKDQETGKQLGIRADITPQIARIDEHYLKTDKVSRYSYSGEVVRSYPTGYGNVKNPTVTGVELFGCESWEADAEIVCLLVSYLQKIKLTDFILDIGNVDIVTELLLFLGVRKENFSTFIDAIIRKDKKDIKFLIKTHQIEHKDAIGYLFELTKLNGNEATLNKAKETYSKIPKVLEAISLLEQVITSVINRFPELSINLDLGDIRGYGYHNGLIFAIYHPSQWQTLAKGGRYDRPNNLKNGDNSRPATGFSCNLNTIARVMGKIKNSKKMILCDLPYSKKLQDFVDKCRKDNIVISQLNLDEMNNQKYTHKIVETNGDFEVAEID